MSKGTSQWNKFLNILIQRFEDTGGNCSYTAEARRINEQENLNLSGEEIDLFRTYIRRTFQKLRKKKLGSTSKLHNKTTKKIETRWEEEKDGSAIFEYKGEKPIKTLEEAINFSEVDLNVWEVDRHVFNAWDVSMKHADGKSSFKRTNYQVKVWFKRKAQIKTKKPVFRHIVKTSKRVMEMWVSIGCIHRPFHDKILWDKFLHFLEENHKDITGIIINGDYLDLRSLSSHEDWIPDGIDLEYEYSDGLQGIYDIETRLKKDIDKIFHYGNHEDRFFRDKQSIRKYGKSLPSPHEALELEERGWDIITDWKNGYTTLGNDLDIFHGTKIGMNAAKDQLQAIPNRDHIFNHTHRFGSYSNQTNTSYNLGCMIDFESDTFKYVDRGIRASWAHGFGIIYVDEKNNTHVYPIKVDNDRSFFFKGKVY